MEEGDESSKWFKEIFNGERFVAWGKEIWGHKKLILISLIFLIIATILDYKQFTFFGELEICLHPNRFLIRF